MKHNFIILFQKTVLDPIGKFKLIFDWELAVKRPIKTLDYTLGYSIEIHRSVKSTAAWNQPRKLFYCKNRVETFYMWLTSNYMYFRMILGKINPLLFNKLLKSPSLCSGWFQNFIKNLGLIFPKSPSKTWLLVLIFSAFKNQISSHCHTFFV